MLFNIEELELIIKMGEEYLTNQGPNNQHDISTFLSICKKLGLIYGHKNCAINYEELFRLIVGHSDYHGDAILCAMVCLAEGKEVNMIRPLEE